MTNLESDHSSESIDFGQYLNLLWHWAWLIILAGILAGGMAFLVSKYIPPVYQAKTTVIVNDLPANQTVDYSSIQSSLQLSQLYSQMMTKTPILDEVAKRLGLNKIDPKDITAQSVTNMQLINITVESKDPTQAAMIANTLITVFREQEQTLRAEQFTRIKESLQAQINETEGLLHTANDQLNSATLPADIELISTKIADYQQAYNSLLLNYTQVGLSEAETVTSIVQIEPATTPDKPVRPNILINVLLAILAGSILGAVMVYLIGIMDRTLKTPEEFSEKLGLPILGTISHYKKSPGATILEEDPQSPVSEAFRALRTNIKFADTETTNPVHTILIISPLAGEGKTNVTVNLGMVIAQNGQRVCLIDANLRQPGIHDLLHVSNTSGLSQALETTDPEFSIKKIIKPTKVKNLDVVTSGKILPNPSELLGSIKMRELLELIRASTDMILIDTPPALAVTDASVLLPYADGVLLVMKADSIQLELARRLIKQLMRMNANILGIVVNDLNNRYFHAGYKQTPQQISLQRQKKSRPPAPAK